MTDQPVKKVIYSVAGHEYGGDEANPFLGRLEELVGTLAEADKAITDTQIAVKFTRARLGELHTLRAIATGQYGALSSDALSQADAKAWLEAAVQTVLNPSHRVPTGQVRGGLTRKFTYQEGSGGFLGFFGKSEPAYTLKPEETTVAMLAFYIGNAETLRSKGHPSIAQLDEVWGKLESALQGYVPRRQA